MSPPPAFLLTLPYKQIILVTIDKVAQKDKKKIKKKDKKIEKAKKDDCGCWQTI